MPRSWPTRRPLCLSTVAPRMGVSPGRKNPPLVIDTGAHDFGIIAPFGKAMTCVGRGAPGFSIQLRGINLLLEPSTGGFDRLGWLPGCSGASGMPWCLPPAPVEIGTYYDQGSCSKEHVLLGSILCRIDQTGRCGKGYAQSPQALRVIHIDAPDTDLNEQAQPAPSQVVVQGP